MERRIIYTDPEILGETPVFSGLASPQKISLTILDLESLLTISPMILKRCSGIR